METDGVQLYDLLQTASLKSISELSFRIHSRFRSNILFTKVFSREMFICGSVFYFLSVLTRIFKSLNNKSHYYIILCIPMHYGLSAKRS
jgi:hypothetical protein